MDPRQFQFDYIDSGFISYGKNHSVLKMLQILDNYFPSINEIVDIGCGAGGFASFSSKNYVGVDIRHLALATARAACPWNTHLFVCADAENLPFMDSSVDTFISSNMIEHTPNPNRIFQEIYRVAQGRGIFFLPCSDTFPILEDPLNYVLLRLKRKPANHGIFGFGHGPNLPKFEEWKKMIAEAGFNIERILPFDNSLFTQIEFMLFSFLATGRDYSAIPARNIPRGTFLFFNFFHCIARLFDIRTRKSSCKCFIVSKRKNPRSFEARL